MKQFYFIPMKAIAFCFLWVMCVMQNSNAYYPKVADRSSINESLTAGSNPAVRAISTNIQDSLALVDLYNSTNGPGWTFNNGWLRAPVNFWQGIHVEDGRVTSIYLASNKLHGIIPSSIGNLTELTLLGLIDNQLSGTIPSSIGNLTQLTELSLASNQLTGAIPSNIQNLTLLENIFLGNNQLTGNIPLTIGSLRQLVYLELSGNQLSGTIPSNIGNLSQLSDLNVGSNHLSGSLPASIWNLTHLALLDVSSNQFTGTIPASIENLKQLFILNISSNHFSGTMPSNVINLPFLTQVNISNNQFTNIPVFPTHIQNLNIENNQLTFQDIILNLSPNRTCTYSPQGKVGNSVTSQVLTGNTFTFDLGIDPFVSNNAYNWFKNDQFYSQTSVNKLIINNVSQADAGVYTCMITNHRALGLTLLSNPDTLLISLGPPIITSFTPDRGQVGTFVTITGSNFSSIHANEVFFGAIRAQITASSSTQIVAIVPPGASTQLISITDSISHLTCFSNKPFIVPDITPPAIPRGLTAVNVHFSKAILNWTANSEGDIAAYKIYGHFNPNNLIATVHAPITSFIDTSLINDTTYTYTISAVDTSGNESQKSAPVPVFIAFEQAPVISSFSPATGRVGSPVSISGLNFSHIPAFSKVLFGTIRARINTASRTRLTVIVPPGATSQFISVTDSLSHLTGFSNKPFIVTDTTPPAVPRGLTGVNAHFSKAVLNWTPNTENDLASYRIYGHGNFNNLIAVVNAPITTFIDTNLIDNSAYAYRISAVDTARNESAKSDSISVFISFEPPVISSFVPTSGPVGTTVTISGLNFSTIPASNKVFFGATRAQVTSASRNQLVVKVPSGATFQPISVTDSLSLLTGFSNNPFRTTFGPAGGQPLNSNSFGPNVSVGSNSLPSSIAISDLDGDGKPDLVVTNQGNNKVSVYRNISSGGSITAGSFATKVDFVTGTGPLKVVIADINGDGKPDLIIANSNNTVSVFKNTSSAGTINTSSFAPRINFNTFAGANSVAYGDLDGDGKTDLVIGGGTGFSVLHNISSGGNLDSTFFEHGVLFSSASAINSVAIGDLDNDGKPDLAFTTAANTISVYKNTSVRGSITTSSFASAVNFAVGSGPRDVKMADLDGDGKPELVTINFGGGSGTSTSILHNISTTGTITSGSFEAEVEFTTATGSSSLAIGDLNGDGKPEIATVANGNNSISVLLNTTTPGSINNNSFAPKFDFSLAAGAVPNALAIGDLNADGRPDLCAANVTNNGILQNNLVNQLLPVEPGLIEPGDNENLIKVPVFSKKSDEAVEPMTAPTSDEIKLYPNPSTGKITIELPNADPSSIEIMDMSMRVIKKGDYHKSLIVLDISNIAYGFYLVRIRQGNSLKTIKVERE